MADVALDLSGADQLARSADAAAAGLRDLTATDRDAGDLVLGAARIPRRTGLLESTAVVQVDAVGVSVTVGGPAAPYVGYVHSYNPFLTEAYSATETEVVDLYFGRLAAAVDTIQGA